MIDYYPLILLGIGVLTILLMILWLRVNAFVGLIVAALLIGALTPNVREQSKLDAYANLYGALDREMGALQSERSYEEFTAEEIQKQDSLKAEAKKLQAKAKALVDKIKKLTSNQQKLKELQKEIETLKKKNSTPPIQKVIQQLQNDVEQLQKTIPELEKEIPKDQAEISSDVQQLQKITRTLEKSQFLKRHSRQAATIQQEIQNVQSAEDDTGLDLRAAIQNVAVAFGDMMMKIGITIAMAMIIGKALMDSGAADRIVRSLSNLMGEKRASLALLASGFILSVPVFFDNVFFLLVPLARSLRARTGKNYITYLLAIGAGGAITHSLVPPTPGPIGMANTLGVDLGTTILIGILVGAPLSFVGYLYGRWANNQFDIPFRQVGEVTVEELEQQALRPDSELPSLFWSLMPIILPVLLIATFTVFKAVNGVMTQEPAGSTTVLWSNPGFGIAGTKVSLGGLLMFLGEPKIALTISAFIAVVVAVNKRGMTRQQAGHMTGEALTEGAMILLITCAGGAFGAMLKSAGVGDTLKELGSRAGIDVLILAWGMAVLLKIAQGSGTVAMITTAGMLGVQSDLDYHPVYLVMAIGAGSLVGSWMNDSGFWVVGKLGGMTEAETLKTWTITLVIMGVAGLPFIWMLTKQLPLTSG